jgi:hypothetical protein
LAKGQSTVVTHGQRLCRELGRSSRHRWNLCRRLNGRAVSTVGGSPNVMALAPSPMVHSMSSAGPQKRLDYAAGPSLLTAQPSAKVAMPWVLLCRERLSAKICCVEGPIKSPRQRHKPSTNPEFPVVNPILQFCYSFTGIYVQIMHQWWTFSDINSFLRFGKINRTCWN